MEQNILRLRRVPRDSFALRLVAMRHELDLSQDAAAERCGLKASTWATWENGARPRAMNDVVEKIADGLGFDRGWLMFGGAPTRQDGPDGPGGLEISHRAWNGDNLVDMEARRNRPSVTHRQAA